MCDFSHVEGVSDPCPDPSASRRKMIAPSADSAPTPVPVAVRIATSTRVAVCVPVPAKNCLPVIKAPPADQEVPL